LASENTVALTPMPRANAVTATVVNQGFFARVRRPKGTSSQRLMWGEDGDGGGFVPGMTQTPLGAILSLFKKNLAIMIAASRRKSP
jgi:hypothetical protein